MAKKHINVTTGSTKAGYVFIKFYFKGKRYRFSNGNSIKRAIHPNKENCLKTRSMCLKLLQSAFELALHDGWRPEEKVLEKKTSVKNIQQILNHSLEHYTKSSCSDIYLRDLKWSMKIFLEYLNKRSVEINLIDELDHQSLNTFFKERKWSNRTKRNVRSSLIALFGCSFEENGLNNPFKAIIFKKSKPVLHKPFDDVFSLLEDIKSYNSNLHLCCLLTYGCLLRPHQEIRNLKWGDFNAEMTHISLPSNRNKSGRNRIVPLNPFILKFIERGRDENNIFTNSPTPYNKDYFKTLWRRYKAQSSILEDLQTLYSFRHSGAIEIYNRTGSLTTLQSAMGHASLAVTLGYLRGLEIPCLRLEDMPRL